jgi:ATP-dependent Clp protease ATP-binding subunit ClpB
VSLNPERWTVKTQEAFTAATELAKARNNPEVTVDHLLAALLGQQDGVVLPILQRVGVNPLSLRNQTTKSSGGCPAPTAARCECPASCATSSRPATAPVSN